MRRSKNIHIMLRNLKLPKETRCIKINILSSKKEEGCVVKSSWVEHSTLFFLLKNRMYHLRYAHIHMFPRRWPTLWRVGWKNTNRPFDYLFIYCVYISYAVNGGVIENESDWGSESTQIQNWMDTRHSFWEGMSAMYLRVRINIWSEWSAPLGYKTTRRPHCHIIIPSFLSLGCV